MTGLTRRHLLLRAVPLGVAGIAFARAVRAADACVGPDTESLRASLNYTGTGADAAAACAHCAFFTADSARRLRCVQDPGRSGRQHRPLRLVQPAVLVRLPPALPRDDPPA